MAIGFVKNLNEALLTHKVGVLGKANPPNDLAGDSVGGGIELIEDDEAVDAVDLAGEAAGGGPIRVCCLLANDLVDLGLSWDDTLMESGACKSTQDCSLRFCMNPDGVELSRRSRAAAPAPGCPLFAL